MAGPPRGLRNFAENDIFSRKAHFFAVITGKPVRKNIAQFPFALIKAVFGNFFDWRLRRLQFAFECFQRLFPGGQFLLPGLFPACPFLIL